MRKTTTYYPGETLSLIMMKPVNGAFPISRTEDGRICLIDRSIKKGFWPYNSVWSCEIEDVKDKAIIIKPLFMEKSAEVMERECAEKAQKAFGNKAEVHREKPKFVYNYKSKNG